MHRAKFDWSAARKPGPIYEGIRALLEIRRQAPALAGCDLQVFDPGNAHVLGFRREHSNQRLLVLANVSENSQSVPADILRSHGNGYQFTDLISKGSYSAEGELSLRPYQLLLLVGAQSRA